jgi:uncharacterized protein YbaA (DUF1428 family)
MFMVDGSWITFSSDRDRDQVNDKLTTRWRIRHAPRLTAIFNGKVYFD